jgi:hypothetical protein
MDYNKDGKGFVCAVYKLICGRKFYAVCFAVLACLLAALNFSDFVPQEEDRKLTALYALIACAAGFALNFAQPLKFAPKIVGFLTAIASLGVALHNLNALNSSLFYAAAALEIGVIVALLCWFVYNARSEEI